MAGDFYGAFDRECLVDDFNSKRGEDYRSVFHQDRDRIMFSPAFRRLQTKTQVFQAGEYDFYRTRLTHSLEVSRIAESIAIWLRNAHPQVVIDLHLLEAICLAHDIGHPPFGHAGERALNQLMQSYGGFEGNAQTLRMLTRMIYSRSKGGRGGMTPTRALIDGVLKYKRLYRQRGKETNHFIYDDQSEIVSFCFGGADLGRKIGVGQLNKFKSVECQIMDAADDIAYSCFDIVDGSKARFITPDRLDSWAAKRNASPKESERLDEEQMLHLKTLKEWILKDSIQPQMNKFLGKQLIQGCSLASAENFMSKKTNRYAYDLVVSSSARKLIKLQTKLCAELVYGSSALQQIEYKGGEILRGLASSLFENYLRSRQKYPVLVPNSLHNLVLEVRKKSEKARLLCDHLSGMTDAYALRSYKRLLDPDYGSISELI